MAHTVEILERRGEAEVSWSALCLECGWISEDTRSRARAELLAAAHRDGLSPAYPGPPWGRDGSTPTTRRKR